MYTSVLNKNLQNVKLMTGIDKTSKITKCRGGIFHISKVRYKNSTEKNKVMFYFIENAN